MLPMQLGKSGQIVTQKHDTLCKQKEFLAICMGSMGNAKLKRRNRLLETFTRQNRVTHAKNDSMGSTGSAVSKKRTRWG